MLLDRPSGEPMLATPTSADVAPLESIDPTRRYATVSGGDAEPLGDGGGAAAAG